MRRHHNIPFMTYHFPHWVILALVVGFCLGFIVGGAVKQNDIILNQEIYGEPGHYRVIYNGEENLYK